MSVSPVCNGLSTVLSYRSLKQRQRAKAEREKAAARDLEMAERLTQIERIAEEMKRLEATRAELVNEAAQLANQSTTLELVRRETPASVLPGALDTVMAVFGENFSPRETEVGLLLISGLVYKEIAAKLGCTVRTVKFHLANMFEKSGATDRTNLAIYLLRELASRGRRYNQSLPENSDLRSIGTVKAQILEREDCDESKQHKLATQDEPSETEISAMSPDLLLIRLPTSKFYCPLHKSLSPVAGILATNQETKSATVRLSCGCSRSTATEMPISRRDSRPVSNWPMRSRCKRS